jgi:hypothetical protein
MAIGNTNASTKMLPYVIIIVTYVIASPRP